jgi:UDP-glucose 4-epimerase
MRWLITGGCGFVGSALVARLVREGRHQLRVVDNLTVGTRGDLALVCQYAEVAAPDARWGATVDLIVADVQDEAAARMAARDADVIVHLAANTGVGPSVEDPRSDMLANVIGTFNYLDAARHNGVPRFVFASSGAPIGDVDPPIHEELPAKPVSPYGASKLAGEGYCSAFYRSFGVQTVVLRFGNVYGPGSAHKASVVAKFIKRALDGEVLEIYGDGAQTRDFIFIDDLIEAICRSVIADRVGGEIFQIATNAETTVGELVTELLAALNAAGVTGVSVEHRERRVGDVQRNYSDTSKAFRLLGWRSRYPLTEGLKETVQYFLRDHA